MKILSTILLTLSALCLGAETVDLAWDASTDPVSGYVIYIGTSSGTYSSTTNVGLNLTRTIQNLSPGITYYFAAKAIGTNSIESDFSNEISYSVPFPNNQPPIVNIFESSKVVLDGNINVQIPFYVNDDWINPDDLDYVVSTSNNEIIPGGQILGSGTNRVLELNINSYQIGSATVTLTVSDGFLFDSDDVIITIKSWINIERGITPDYVIVSWPQYRTGILQYKTDLLSPTWVNSPTYTNNPAIFNTDGIPIAFFRVFETNIVVIPDSPVITFSNSVVSQNANNSIVINSSGNDLIVLTLASETSSVDASISSTPSLSWQKVGDADVSSAEIWVAESTSSGQVVINFAWSGWASSDCSAVVYSIEGYGTPINTTSTTGSAQITPNLTVSGVQDNSLIIIVSSDWNAILSNITYRNTPVTEVLRVGTSGAYQCSHWYKEVVAGGNIVVGQSSPTGQSAGTVAYVVKPN